MVLLDALSTKQLYTETDAGPPWIYQMCSTMFRNYSCLHQCTWVGKPIPVHLVLQPHPHPVELACPTTKEHVVLHNCLFYSNTSNCVLP